MKAALFAFLVLATVVVVPFPFSRGCVKDVLRDLAGDIDNIADDLEDDDDNHSILDWFDGDRDD